MNRLKSGVHLGISVGQKSISKCVKYHAIGGKMDWTCCQYVLSYTFQNKDNKEKWEILMMATDQAQNNRAQGCTFHRFNKNV